MSKKKPSKIEKCISLLDSTDTIKFTGVKWRKPTPEEVIEITTFETLINLGEYLEVEGYSKEEYDAEYDEIFEDIHQEFEKFLMVLDFELMEKQLFHSYIFAISSTTESASHCIELILVRYIKQNQTISYFEPDEFQIDI